MFSLKYCTQSVVLGPWFSSSFSSQNVVIVSEDQRQQIMLISLNSAQFVLYIINLFPTFTANVMALGITMMEETHCQYYVKRRRVWTLTKTTIGWDDLGFFSAIVSEMTYN